VLQKNLNAIIKNFSLVNGDKELFFDSFGFITFLYFSMAFARSTKIAIESKNHKVTATKRYPFVKGFQILEQVFTICPSAVNKRNKLLLFKQASTYT